MPGSTPATSQLDWLSSTMAMIVLSWSKATRDLLKSFSWGIGALRQLFASDDGAISFAVCPIPSFGSARDRLRFKLKGGRHGRRTAIHHRRGCGDSQKMRAHTLGGSEASGIVDGRGTGERDDGAHAGSSHQPPHTAILADQGSNLQGCCG